MVTYLKISIKSLQLGLSVCLHILRVEDQMGLEWSSTFAEASEGANKHASSWLSPHSLGLPQFRRTNGPDNEPPVLSVTLTAEAYNLKSRKMPTHLLL